MFSSMNIALPGIQMVQFLQKRYVFVCADIRLALYARARRYASYSVRRTLYYYTSIAVRELWVYICMLV